MQEYDRELTTGNQGTNGMSIAGFVLGIVSLIYNIFWIPSILAIVFSAIGLAQVSKSRQKGKVFAIIGLVAGIATILLSIVAIFALLSL